MARPLLGDIDLQQVQKIETEEDQVFTQHSIPALEGDFFQQGLGRRATWVKLTGVLTGAEVQAGLKTLRDKFRAAEPVDFVADITTATKVNQVIIEEMGVRELAGKPSRFEYALTLREYVPAPTPQPEPPQPVPPRPHPVEWGTLIVEVVVEGEPNFDYNTVTVTVEGTQEDGTSVSRRLANHSENIWTEDPFPVGQYTVRAVVTDPPPMNGSVNAVVRGGQTTQVTITLRRDRPTNIAKEFVVHFRFDNAFVEPCMRHVLRKVADYARNHADEKLLIVGNTDKSGSDDYNLSLGDRRARSVYAYLTFGRDATTRSDALAEWNLLRQPADGQQRTVRDKWGVSQYQYMLQSLGFYPGNIDGQHGPLTNTGVRDFQTSKNLPATGVVNDATWAALIEAYLSQDPQSVPDSQFLRNCGDEPLKWVSCGEQRPRKDTPTDNCAPELAWRPNRRTELVFVRAERLPRPEPKPVTFNLPGTPPVGSGWCVGPDDPNASRCSFLKEGGTNPAPDEWSVEPAEPGTITVSGSIVDENGNPLGNTKYVLIAPDGEFMDGERKCGSERGRPIIDRTAPDGTFSYTKQTPIGVYTMEVDLPPGPHVAHAATKPPATGRGSVVCKRLDSNDSQFDVIVRSGAASQFAVNPVITLASSVVVVKKSYTNPARKLVTLSTDSTFIGSGTFTRSSDAIRFFTATVGGTEITFNGTDNVFDGTLLTTGVQLFAEGASPSVAMDDVQLTLSLSSADLLVGSPVTATMTSVELTLDVALSRTSPGVDPTPLSTNDKINLGRFVQVRDPSFSHERTMLIVRPPNPSTFTGTLVLTPINDLVEAFIAERAATGQTRLPNPHAIASSAIPAGGVQLWAEGTAASAALRDTEFRLGIQGVENEGDRIAMTTVQIEVTEFATVASPALTFVRFGLWDRAYDAAGEVKNSASEADNFIGADTRKFHFRVRNPIATGNISINWKTLNADGVTDDDAPASPVLTLVETTSGSKVFISKAVMLVTDGTDRNFPTNSGLSAPLDTGLQNAERSNHRTRRAKIDGLIRGEYSPQAGVRLPLALPVFQRNSDERRRVIARVIRYTNPTSPGFAVATDAYIAGQFAHANQRWNQIGIQIDSTATVDRPIPPAALDVTGVYGGSLDNPNEQAALTDLISSTPDNTLTVVFVPLSGANAYATIAQRNQVHLGDRYFIFIDTTLALTDETLAHELAHVLFNRFDTATDRRFFTLNTNSPTSLVSGTEITLPDVRIYRRIQNLNSPNPNADPNNDNVINWVRRRRTDRFPIAPGLSAATATTGNTLTQNF